jgi:hypothetical protein
LTMGGRSDGRTVLGIRANKSNYNIAALRKHDKPMNFV